MRNEGIGPKKYFNKNLSVNVAKMWLHQIVPRSATLAVAFIAYADNLKVTEALHLVRQQR
jgi:hypothetical protein